MPKYFCTFRFDHIVRGGLPFTYLCIGCHLQCNVCEGNDIFPPLTLVCVVAKEIGRFHALAILSLRMFRFKSEISHHTNVHALPWDSRLFGKDILGLSSIGGDFSVFL